MNLVKYQILKSSQNNLYYILKEVRGNWEDITCNIPGTLWFPTIADAGNHIDSLIEPSNYPTIEIILTN